ncbi:MAG TPA: protein kinase [Gemmataceae bacterium]|nr:protein kinase [Gemmataceae bacterium]
MPVDVCPSAEEFRKLLSGELSAADVDAIAQHLESCARCPETLQSLGDDTLVRALRSGSGKVTGYPARIERLISRCLFDRTISQPDTNADSDTTPPAENESPDGIDLSFLSPPQQGDEIGRLNGYRVLRLLGAGGMGMVLEAEDIKLNRPVALKVMRPEMAARPTAKDRFLREAQAAAKLSHDHIVTIYQVGEDNGVPFIALQFLTGESLADRLKRERLPIVEVVRIGQEIASGLAAAHNRGLIHRDIKPANIWLEDPKPTDGSPWGAGRVKILDFGIARISSEKGQLTQTGAILGTPAYMAPEQARGKPVDARADLFSLGCVLYEMSIGRRPFQGDDPLSILSSLALDEPPLPHEVDPQVPLALSALIQQLLAKEPEQRTQNAAEAMRALAAIQAELKPTITAGTASMNPWKEINRYEPKSTAVEKSRLALASKQRLSQRKRWIIGMAIAVLLFFIVGVSLAGYWMTFKTKDGTLVVQVDGDADVRFKNDKIEIYDESGTILKYQLQPSDRNKTLPPGKYVIRVTGPDGLKLDTDRFEMTRAGMTVHVSVDQSAAVMTKKEDKNPDRRAAEWVLSLGGTVQVNSTAEIYRSATQLPAAKFNLTSVELGANKSVTDTDLVRLKDCTNLMVLDLHDTRIGDAGLAHLKDYKKLTYVQFGDTQITDAGLAYLKNCKDLAHLNLYSTRVGDEGMANFQDFRRITHLDLSTTDVTDKGLANFKDCKKLERLALQSTAVTDTGLAYFKDCKHLVHLNLNMTQVTDRGLAYFKDCKLLSELKLQKTNVSPAAVEAFAKDIPQCKIILDDRLIEPKQSADPDRRVAEWVVSAGGFVVVRPNFMNEKNAWYVVDKSQSADVRKPPSGNSAWGAGEVILTPTLPAGPVELMRVSFYRRQLSDDGLAQIAPATGIVWLNLENTAVTGAGLAHLKGMKKLTDLVLTGTRVGDDGLKHLQPLTHLEGLWLNNTSISDAGLLDLQGLSSLQRLYLHKTKGTAPGVAKLQKALPTCKIASDFDTLEPKTPGADGSGAPK